MKNHFSYHVRRKRRRPVLIFIGVALGDKHNRIPVIRDFNDSMGYNLAKIKRIVGYKCYDIPLDKFKRFLNRNNNHAAGRNRALHASAHDIQNANAV